MKSVVVFLSAVTFILAAPPRGNVRYSPGRDAQIVIYENEDYYGGNYRFKYEQTDGQRHEARGELKNAGRDDEFVAVSGSYGWIGPDDVEYIVNYTADEDGYKPEIQQGPGGGVPPAVVASLLG